MFYGLHLGKLTLHRLVWKRLKLLGSMCVKSPSDKSLQYVHPPLILLMENILQLTSIEYLSFEVFFLNKIPSRLLHVTSPWVILPRCTGTRSTTWSNPMLEAEMRHLPALSVVGEGQSLWSKSWGNVLRFST